MNSQHAGYAIVMLIMLAISVNAYDLIKLSNPQIQTDYIRSNNFSDSNITVDWIFGSIPCSNITQDGGGTDTDFCNDQSGAGGDSKTGKEPQLYNDSTYIYANVTWWAVNFYNISNPLNFINSTTLVELDPQVHTLVSDKWCSSNGTVIDCEVTPVVDTNTNCSVADSCVSIVYTDELDNSTIIRTLVGYINNTEFDNTTIIRTLIGYVNTTQLDNDTIIRSLLGYINSTEFDNATVIRSLIGYINTTELDNSTIIRTLTGYINTTEFDNSTIIRTLAGYINATQFDNATIVREGDNQRTTIDWANITSGIPSGLADGDDDTTYSNGTGLTLSGTEFAIYLPYFTGLFLSLTAYTHLSNFTDDLGDRGYTSLSNFSNDPGYITTYTETDPLYADDNGTISRTGDCPAGQVVMNSTTSGPECVTVSGEGTTPHDLNGTNHTGNLDTIRVVQNAGTYFQGTNQQSINDLLFSYISGLAYIPSHFGTSDGATDASVSWGSTGNYYISNNAGASGMDDGGWDDGSTHPVTTDTTYQANVANDFYDLSSESNLSMYVNGIQVDNLQFDGTTSPPDGTYMTITGEAENEIGFIYGKLTSNAPLGTMTTKGYSYIVLNHSNVSGSASYSDDTTVYLETGAAGTIGAVEVGEYSFGANKNVSGIQYYTDGDKFNVTIASSSNAYKYTYTSYVITCEYSYDNFGGGTVNYNYNDAGISGVSSPPKWDDTITFSKTQAFTVAGNAHDNSATIRCRLEGGIRSDSSYDVSTASNYLVNSYGTTSTAITEGFDDENYRLPEGDYDSTGFSTTGQWGSSDCLTDGQALLQLGRLDYPHTNWGSGYNPPENTCDYSAFAEDANYTRAIDSVSTPHTSITLTLSPLTASDIGAAGTVDVWVKLPTQTGWLDAGKAYDSGTFTGADGDGCQTSASSSTFGCTFGPFSTANSDYTIVIKFIMNSGTSEYVESITTDW